MPGLSIHLFCALFVIALVPSHSALLPHDDAEQVCSAPNSDGSPCETRTETADGIILLQGPGLPKVVPTPEVSISSPHLVQLRRESVPVRRKGEIVSFKTSYSGEVRVGRGPEHQVFRVVFDTGSGQVVLPSMYCQSETCQRHKRYNISGSTSGTPINADGSIVNDDDETCDQVTVGYGTGSITGEFAKETICLGERSGSSNDAAGEGEICVNVNLVMAIEMSAQPFLSFNFDGIVGLGLSSLSLSDDFSFFGQMSRHGANSPKMFGVFLTEGETGESSEIAFGGYNSKKMIGDVSWASVPNSKLGYWQVDVLGIKVGNITMPFCQEPGSCRGAVDTGSSHLGVPTHYFAELFRSLTVASGDSTDCREVEAPEIEILLDGFSLTIAAENYMRRLPLAPGVNPGGVSSSEAGVFSAKTATAAGTAVDDVMNCKPRLMPVTMAAPLGPNLFILGEPVLHKYYSVFDWQKPQVGFALAATKQNSGQEELEDSIFLVQLRVTVTLRVPLRLSAQAA